MIQEVGNVTSTAAQYEAASPWNGICFNCDGILNLTHRLRIDYLRGPWENTGLARLHLPAESARGYGVRLPESCIKVLRTLSSLSHKAWLAEG